MEEGRKKGLARVLAPISEVFGLSKGVALGAFVFVSAIVLFGLFWFFYSAPPHVITITSGPLGSGFHTNAMKYSVILARKGVTLRILPSQGSFQNLKRLDDSSFRVDVGFVQSGITNEYTKNEKVVSLGSISYQPLLVFYRSATPITLLSEFKGKRVAVGARGSGTRSVALMLFELNGIEPGGPTQLLEIDAEEAAKALLDNEADAIFLMGDSASTQLMKKLLLRSDIQLMDFVQAEGYTRRISFLNKLQFPKGSIDFGKNIPAHDTALIGPTVELLARAELHPALCDLLIEAAREVHGPASLMRRKDEFPNAIQHDYPISIEAARFYKSGKTFFYRYLPFWLASLVNRILVVFVPMIVLLVPGLKVIPSLFRWRIKLQIYRWYRALLGLERDLAGKLSPVKRQELLARLDDIERGVNQMKVPASFADQFYALRGTINFVRTRLAAGEPASP